jgi:hypothetical protein
MATPAQISANQQNAALSTGPKTPEGKAAAARNATKHGLSGAFTVLPHEDQAEFDSLVAALRDEFHPAGQHESFLVEQMAQSRWRLSRARRLETALFDQMLKGYIPADDDQRIAAKLVNGGDRALASIQRYASAAERSYYKAHTELLKSRQLQNKPDPTDHRPLTTGHCLSQNEPNPTGHRPLTTGHGPTPPPARTSPCGYDRPGAMLAAAGSTRSAAQ